MKNSTKLFGGIFAVVIMSAFAISSVFAYQGNYSKQGPSYSPERHSAIEEAMESNNYKAWKELMNGKGRITQVVNVDNFARFAEAHKLVEEGNLEKAKVIRVELGLGLKNGSGRDQGQRENGQKKEFRRGQRSGLKNGSSYSHNN